MTRIVPSVFPGHPAPDAQPCAKTADLQESRRPDSNRGPLHYEGSPANTPAPGATAFSLQAPENPRAAEGTGMHRGTRECSLRVPWSDDLTAARGIVLGLAIAVVFWLAVAIAVLEVAR